MHKHELSGAGLQSLLLAILLILVGKPQTTHTPGKSPRPVLHRSVHYFSELCYYKEVSKFPQHQRGQRKSSLVASRRVRTSDRILEHRFPIQAASMRGGFSPPIMARPRARSSSTSRTFSLPLHCTYYTDRRPGRVSVPPLLVRRHVVPVDGPRGYEAVCRARRRPGLPPRPPHIV